MGQVETSQRSEEAQAARARARVRIGKSMKAVAAAGGIGCPGCSLTGAAHRECLETLATEVEGARQENKRLTLKSQDMQQRAVQDRISSCSSGQTEKHPDPAHVEEMFQLKQVLWQLQRDNAELKGEVLAVDAICVQESAESPAKKLAASNPFSLSSVATPARAQLRSGSSSRPRISSKHGSEKPSHRGSEKSSRRSSEKSVSGPPDAELEVRQKIQALQKDNTELRQKVRMLAVS